MLTFTTSIIIAVVCIIIGLGIGMILAMAFNRGGDNKKADASSDDRYTQVATLLRDSQDNSLLAEIDGRLYASAEPLNDGQREALEKTARDWYTWLRLAPEPEVETPPPAPRQAAAPTKTIPLATPARPETDRMGGMAVPLAVAASGKDKKLPVVEKSIVEQIDEILQDMVAGTPLSDKSIRLVEDPTQGVIVWIGLEHFEGINSVPDIEARTIIQAAVREWEKKSEVKPK